jgi:hypothetical protein
MGFIGSTLRESVCGATRAGCIVVLGAAATIFAGTVLWIPHIRKRSAERAAAAAAMSADAAAAVKFETLYWDEYDRLLATAAPATATTATTATTAAVTERSPQGDVITMVYLSDRDAFGYYTDRKNGITYSQLETVARKYLVDHSQREIAVRAYADRRSKTAGKSPTTTSAGADDGDNDSDVIDLGGGGSSSAKSATATDAAVKTETSGGIFAMFRRYNRKPAAVTVPASGSGEAPLEYTRFVYLGPMHEFNANTNAVESASTDCDAIDYAEFKRMKFKI